MNLPEERDAAPWLATSSVEEASSFSPDGGWVAYHSDDSGPLEVHVRPYSRAGGRHQVSNQGGVFPRWSRDGREIFFLSQGSLWSAGHHHRAGELVGPDETLNVGFDLTGESRVVYLAGGENPLK